MPAGKGKGARLEGVVLGGRHPLGSPHCTLEGQPGCPSMGGNTPGGGRGELGYTGPWCWARSQLGPSGRALHRQRW